MTASIVSLLMLYQISSLEHVVYNTNNMIRESLAFLKKSSDVRRCYVYAVRRTAAMMSPLINLNLAVKLSTNAYWNTGGTDHWKKNRRVLNEKVNGTSKNRGFRTNNHSVATYEQVKEGLSYFYPKRIVETDGIHAQPLIL